jgi:D-serine deaminase-like pyridoxal phosphate-dependent protein
LKVDDLIARAGMGLQDIETPALIVDLAAMERNINRLAQRVASGPVGLRLRPHCKTHKCVAIALRQLAAGATGVCCQTIGEAEAMVAGGVRDVFLTNEIVGRAKAERLVVLAHQARVAVCIDDDLQIDDLSLAAAQQNVCLNVLVEINVGGGRCGVSPGPQAAELARSVASRPSLRFAGIQAYHGPAQHLRLPSERSAAIAHAADLAATTAAKLMEVGLQCDTIAGAGTGTFEWEVASGIYNELQCGSYVFMDADYSRNQGMAAFHYALFLLTTVISRRPDRAVCDAGLKAVAIDSGLPLVRDRDDVSYVKASDEHGILSDSSGTLALGNRLLLVPGHCDPTVNLHDHLVAVRNEKVEEVWPIARGR